MARRGSDRRQLGLLCGVARHRGRQRLQSAAPGHAHTAALLDTGEPVTARKLPPQLEYHLFLSHQWGTGQDQMRVTKSRLLEMMPDVQIFLDVDVKGLRLGDLESYVRASEVVLCFCSQGYFSSRNCLRELRAAVRLDKPLLALLETDESKGGMSVEQIRTQLMEADELMLKWFGSADAEALSGARLADALLAREPIEFNRLGPFQDVTMRMIASELLSEPRRIYLRAERLRPPKLGPPRGKDKRFHLFVSTYNRGCKRLVDEVEDFLSGRHSTQAARVCVDVSSQRDELIECDAMLIYLHRRTLMAESAGLISDVARAMLNKVPLLLVHEMQGLSEDARHGCEFAHFYHPEQTPEELLIAGVYSRVAVPLKGGELRRPSIALLAQDLLHAPPSSAGSCSRARSAAASAPPRRSAGAASG